MTESSRKLTLPEVRERFVKYLEDNPTWGSLHIVLEEGDVEDSHVDFCIRWAEEKGDIEGAELGKILKQLSKTQRGKLGQMQYQNGA